MKSCKLLLEFRLEKRMLSLSPPPPLSLSLSFAIAFENLPVLRLPQILRTNNQFSQALKVSFPTSRSFALQPQTISRDLVKQGPPSFRWGTRDLFVSNPQQILRVSIDAYRSTFMVAPHFLERRVLQVHQGASRL